VKSAVPCLLGALALVVLSSAPVRAVEISPDEIKAFMTEARKLLDEKKVVRVPLDRDWSKDSPLKVKEWTIVPFTKEGRLMVVNASEGSRSELLYTSATNEAALCAVDDPDDPGKSVLIFASKGEIMVALSDGGTVYERTLSMKEVAAAGKPAVFVKYGPGRILVLVVNEEAVSKMHEERTNGETVTVDVKARKLTAPSAPGKELDFRKALLIYRLE
jgi:hypothetical protein